MIKTRLRIFITIAVFALSAGVANASNPAVDNVSGWYKLAGVFSNVDSSLNMAVSLAVPMHDKFLSISMALAGFLALFSIGFTNIGRFFGQQSLPHLSIGMMILVAALLYPIRYTEVNQQYINRNTEVFRNGTNLGKFIGGVSKSDGKEKVSFAVMAFHKMGLAIDDIIISAVNEIGRDTSGGSTTDALSGAPLWAFKVFNRKYADMFKDSPSFYRSYYDYIDLCSPAAFSVEGQKIPLKEWRAVGLRGGTRLGVRTLGTGYFHSQGIIGSEINVDGALNVLANTDIGSIASQRRPYGYRILSEGYWAAKYNPANANNNNINAVYLVSGATLERALASRYYQVDSRVISKSASYEPSNTGTAASNEQDKYYFKAATCKDLFNIADKSAAEWYKGYSKYLHTMTNNINISDIDASTMSTYSVALSSMQDDTRYGSYNKGAGTDTWNIFTAHARNLVSSGGAGFKSFFESWKLQEDAPILFGVVSILYSILFAVSPLIIAFAVLYSRHKSLETLALTFAYFHAILIINFIILKYGGGIAVALAYTISGASGGTIPAVREIAEWGLSVEFAIYIGIGSSFLIAYFLVFDERMGLKGLNSSKVVSATGNLKNSAAIAGAAMLGPAKFKSIASLGKGAGEIKKVTNTTSNAAQSAVSTVDPQKKSRQDAEKQFRDPSTAREAFKNVKTEMSMSRHQNKK